MWALVVLALVATLMSTLAVQSLSGHRLANRRRDQLQTDWLARAGLELACAKLLATPDPPPRESVELLPGGKVGIEIKQETALSASYRVTSTAHLKSNDAEIARSLSRTFRRSLRDGRVLIEVLPPEKQ
jgi:hypothetical protein